MKNQFQLLFALLCFVQMLTAQNQLSGTILNHQNEPVPYATVVLYQQQDSVFVKGTATDNDGQFEFKKIPNGTYYLEASMLGFATEWVTDLTFPKDDQQAIKVQLSPDATLLTTVEVTAKVPLLEQKADRLVVNVADNVTSLNGSLLDVMKKVPGMIVVGDKLKMAGQNSITILLNGKSTEYMDIQSLLKDLPGDNIQKVEVIHQPGAEFDAEGTGPIINIVLKKNSLFGTNGTITAGIAKGYDWKYKTGVSLSHYQGKVNVQGSIGWRDYPYYDEMRLTRRIGDDVYEQVSIDPYANQSFNANLGLDWQISKRQTIGFSGRYLDWSSDNVITNTTDIDYADTELKDLQLITKNTMEETWKLRTFNPYYRFEIDSTGHKIDFDFNIVQAKTDGGNTLRSEELNFGVPFPDQRYLQPGATDIYTMQLDYVKPISSAFKFKLGAKYSDANLDNDLQASELDAFGEWQNNQLQSNHFLFDETISAAYAKIDFNRGKWSGTAGLRYENSQSTGYSVTLDTTLTRDISKLFPSFSLSRTLTSELAATFAYSYRLDRPNYSSLNPFVYYLDPFTSERGNPALAPAFTHSMKFNLAYEKQPFFNVEYQSTSDAMVEVTEQDDATGETYLTMVNLESFKNLNISLFFPLSFGGLDGYGGFIANYGKFDSNYLNQSFLRSKWDYTAFVQAEFTLPGKIQSEVSAWYNSGGQEGIVNAQWLYGVDVGFSKEILKEKARISFGVENLLARFMHAEIRYANMDIDLYNRWDGPVFNLQFTYKFGNQHLKTKEKRRSSASDELNRAQRN
ncbi:MAG: outer membrane beta-barrel family protein [Bacteroidota bacterium]